MSVRAGIAGYGLAGEVFHAPLIDSVDGLEVAGIITANPDRQASARAAYPDAEVVPALDDLWDRIDLLVVAAPNRVHVPLALEAMERGVPVVVDKPLAPTHEEGARLVEAAERAEVPLTVFQNRRFDGDFLTLRRLIQEGALGRVTRLESRFERFRPEVAEKWQETAAAGGGLLLDLGSHLVDQALQLFGTPLTVYAEVDKRRPGAEVEDDVFVALTHERDVRSHLWMSSVAPLHGPRFRVSGSERGFASDGLDPQEAQLGRGLRPGDPGYGVGAEGIDPGAYQRFYEAVVPWLSEGAPPPVDPRDSLAGLQVLEAARRSSETRSVVEFG